MSACSKRPDPPPWESEAGLAAIERILGTSQSEIIWFSATDNCSTPSGLSDGSHVWTPRASER